MTTPHGHTPPDDGDRAAAVGLNLATLLVALIVMGLLVLLAWFFFLGSRPGAPAQTAPQAPPEVNVTAPAPEVNVTVPAPEVSVTLPAIPTALPTPSR